MIPISKLSGILSSSDTFTFDQQGATFRGMGGKVVAYYYGEWRKLGMSYNRYPWKWLVNYPDHLPIPSVSMPMTYEWNFLASNLLTVFNATSVFTPGKLTITSTTTDPIVFLPNNLNLIGADCTQININIKKIAGSAWEGKIYFITNADQTWDELKVISAPEPTWAGSIKTLQVTTNGNIFWVNGTIKQIRFDFWRSVDAVYELYSIRILTQGATLAEQMTVYGLPSDEQWAVDWELQQAFSHGIDVFAHSVYWNKYEGLTYNSNFQDYSLLLHTASTQAPGMKFCLQWSNHDTNPFTSISDLHDFFDYVYQYFLTTRYWFVNGKPVFMLFSPDNAAAFAVSLYGGAAGKDGLKVFINQMNAYCIAKPGSVCPLGIFVVAQSSGVDHPYWTGRSGGWVGGFEYAGCGASTLYNAFSAFTDQVLNSSGGSGSTIYPVNGATTYTEFRDVYQMKASWVLTQSNTQLPYWSPLICGWDHRPWQALQGLPLEDAVYAPATKEEFLAHCHDTRNFLLSNFSQSAALSLPPIVTIYAWNEYGEGGYLCPTQKYGWSLIEAIRQAFGTQ